MNEEAVNEVQEESQGNPEEEKQIRVQTCGREIGEVLRKYNCDLDVSMVLRAGSIMPNVRIVPIEDLQPPPEAERPAGRPGPAPTSTAN